VLLGRNATQQENLTPLEPLISKPAKESGSGGGKTVFAEPGLYSHELCQLLDGSPESKVSCYCYFP
jgi:hypothetical protein